MGKMCIRNLQQAGFNFSKTNFEKIIFEIPEIIKIKKILSAFIYRRNNQF